MSRPRKNRDGYVVGKRSASGPFPPPDQGDSSRFAINLAPDYEALREQIGRAMAADIVAEEELRRRLPDPPTFKYIPPARKDTTMNVKDLLPEPGTAWHWEPMNASASERCIVLGHEWRNGEWWVISAGDKNGRQSNPFDRWIEAAVMIGETDEEQNG